MHKVCNKCLFIMFQDFSNHLSKFLSSSTKLVHKRQKKLRHRLDDNLHWRCSTCHSVVPTHQTHLHLSSCLDNISAVETEDHILSPFSDLELSKKLLCVVFKPMDEHERPRTKRLERPTPNLKHPVINDNKSKESKLNFKDKYFIRKDSEKVSISSQTINKSQTPLRKVINKTEEINGRSIRQNISATSPCKTCNREIAPEKFHCHNAFNTNKLSVMRRSKTEDSGKSSTSPNQTSIPHNKANSLNAIKNNFQSNSQDSIAQHKAKTELKVLNDNSSYQICNNSYGNNTLSANQQQCLKAKKGEKLTKEEKNIEVVQSMNKDGCDPAGWEHFKSQLVPCSRCRRTFFPHRLPIHEKSCRGITIKPTMRTTQELTVHTGMKTNISTKSAFLDCTTCGRKYSTTSLTLHELKCRNNNNNKKLSSGKCDNVNEVNNAWEHFKTQLVPCNKCRRKFLPDRLEKHEPICKANPINTTIK